MTVVNTCWGLQEIDNQPYWHLISESGIRAQVFFNNVQAGKGALWSVSAAIQAEPELENAQTEPSVPYYKDMHQIVNLHLERLLNGKESPKDAMGRAGAELRDLIARGGAIDR